jgi:hypothetical protein
MQGTAGLIPELAAGAAMSNGASLITPHRKIGLHECIFAADFVPREDGTDVAAEVTASLNGITFTSSKKSPDPTDLNSWLTGSNRARQWAIDNNRWPVDDGFLDVYVPRIASFDRQFTWAAINKFDKAFRLSMHSKAPGTIESWRTFPTELFNECFVLDLSARKGFSSSNGAAGSGGSGRGRNLGTGGRGSKRGDGGQSGVSTNAWADKNLKYKEVGGKQLCFSMQRHGKCGRASCKFRHDACGVCGKEGHAAQGCPSGAPAP